MCKSKDITFRRGLPGLCLVASMMLISDCSTSSSPERIVQEYKETLNSHNVDSLMEYYSDDIIFEIPSMQMNLSGKPALRGLAEYDSVLNTAMVLTNIRVKGDTVICDITESNDWLNAAGMTSAHYPGANIVVIDRKISLIQAEISDSSAARVNGVLDSLMLWADQHCREKLEEMMPLGVFVYNADNAMNSLDLLREWRLELESDKASE